MEEILKLERLKLPNASGTASNENVFREISKQTGTLIFWESGCKSPPMRKEPCIKITGPEESVRKAKEMLLDRMEIQSNRVVMKMDVTHLEHPSLIGKGGKLIQKVMDCTGCHIHFPDGNKCTTSIKSNHVPIYGDPMSVERARVMIRALIPIQLFFEVPASSCFAPILESFPPESKFLASPFGLMVYSAPSPTGPIVIVRCNQDQFPNLRKEIVTLMEFICCTNGANLPPVHILTDIVHQHIPFVRGPHNCNVEATMKKTGADISFPLIDKKISVKITGNLDCVYMAWQEVMNLLPVSVSFDVNETREVKGEYIDSLKDCGITVFTRPKTKYFIKNVNLRGPEKFSKQMLQFRQRLLRLPTLAFNPDIQDINLASNFQTSLIQQNSPNVVPSPVSSMVSKNLLTEISQLTDYYMQPNPFASMPSTHDENYMESILTNKTTLNENDVDLGAKAAESLKLEDYFLSDDWFKNIPSNSVNQALADLNLSPSSLSSDQSMESKASADPCNLFISEKNSESLAEDYYRKKVQAAKAMRRPIKSIDFPSSSIEYVGGYGFSQSMPASVIKKAAQTSIILIIM
ncbi:hypothetical protein JTE90_005348 [Oedothorax gibbosus]|uniref:K Homology domain-containing protein n=1 Tax=Oedothorax gibbosus TaxID=931172 RepID=A0AAV6UJM0_9ARAC|nr:hypothetical protein JTE90_005348 [Oedothorax gibbosus]